MSLQSELSMGHTAVIASGDRGLPVINVNYVCRDYRLPLPEPQGDWYLRNTAAGALRDGETALVSRLVPGLRGYYTDLGLLTRDTHLVEIPATSRSNRRYGYPATDPLHHTTNGLLHPYSTGEYVLVSTFSSDLVCGQAEYHGLRVLRRPDSVLTNNKARLREASTSGSYAFQMLPGMLLSDEQEIEMAVAAFGGTDHGVWIKFPTGSGGDLVVRIADVNEDTLRAGVGKLRDAVVSAFAEGHFETTIADFWPAQRFVPENFPIVVESDARNMGTVLHNGSTQFVTSRDGSISIVGHYGQLTTDSGEYLGNVPYTPDDTARILIEAQARAVGSYNIRKHEYYGVQGVDWFLIKLPNGQKAVYVVELNSRPTANTPPQIIADKLDAKAWINTNVFTDIPVTDIDGYFDVVGRDLAYGEPERAGLVVPQSFRTLRTDSGDHPSGNFKVLILGGDPEHCARIQNTLERRRIRFTP